MHTAPHIFKRIIDESIDCYDEMQLHVHLGVCSAHITCKIGYWLNEVVLQNNLSIFKHFHYIESNFRILAFFSLCFCCMFVFAYVLYFQLPCKCLTLYIAENCICLFLLNWKQVGIKTTLITTLRLTDFLSLLQEKIVFLKLQWKINGIKRFWGWHLYIVRLPTFPFFKMHSQ